MRFELKSLQCLSLQGFRVKSLWYTDTWERNMREFVFAAVLLLSLPLWGSPSICEKFQFSSDRTSCMEVLNGQQIQQAAADICLGLGFSDDQLSCLKVSKNKTYLASELSLCASSSFSVDAVGCMSASGGALPVLEKEQPLDQIAKLIQESQQALTEGRFADAEVLNKKIEKLSKAN